MHGYHPWEMTAQACSYTRKGNSLLNMDTDIRSSIDNSFSQKEGVTDAHIYPKVASWTEGSLVQENVDNVTPITL